MILRGYARLAFGKGCSMDAVLVSDLAEKWPVYDAYLLQKPPPDGTTAAAPQGRVSVSTAQQYVSLLPAVFRKPLVTDHVSSEVLQRLQQQMAATKQELGATVKKAPRGSTKKAQQDRAAAEPQTQTQAQPPAQPQQQQATGSSLRGRKARGGGPKNSIAAAAAAASPLAPGAASREAQSPGLSQRQPTGRVGGTGSGRAGCSSDAQLATDTPVYAASDWQPDASHPATVPGGSTGQLGAAAQTVPPAAAAAAAAAARATRLAAGSAGASPAQFTRRYSSRSGPQAQAVAEAEAATVAQAAMSFQQGRGVLEAGSTEDFIAAEKCLLELYFAKHKAPYSEQMQFRKAITLLRELPPDDVRVQRFHLDLKWVRCSAAAEQRDGSAARVDWKDIFDTVMDNALKSPAKG